MSWLQERATHWAENGQLPDALIRWGIRRLCGDRLRQESDGGCERDQDTTREFLAESGAGEVAPVPELANEQHYELPQEFFGLALGSHRKYSCCYWGQEADTLNTLDEAEAAALALTCERAELANGQRILELGCGWGSLTLWMAEQYPESSITAVSNSHSQRQYIEGEAAARGITNVEVITTDVNELELEGPFDRVVSVEMFEHVRNHPVLLERISRWLRPGGKLFIHVFVHALHTYPFEMDSDSWMAQMFFSGGIMPSDSYFLRFQDHLRIRDHWRWSGRHYERTANAWLDNVDARRAEALEIMGRVYGEEDAARWLQRWRIFFMACAELWGYRNGDEWWVSHYLFENPVAAVRKPTFEEVAANTPI